jgi:lipopolysaccharide export system protein LptA
VLTLGKGQVVKVDFVEGNWAAIFPVTETRREEKRAMGYASLRYLKAISAAPALEAAPEPAPEPAPETVAQAAPEPAPAPAAPAAPAPGAPAAPEVVAQGQGEVVAKVQQDVAEPEPPARSPQGPKSPVQITSERMVYNDTKRTVIFSGSVEATHDDLVLHADTLTAFFGGKQRSTAETIERIVAEGSVRAVRGTTRGTCSRLTYHVEDGILVMEGDPVLRDGENTISGQVVKFYMKDNRSEVLGGKGQRVKAVLGAPGDLEF